jgi:hypothetical protein
MLAVVPDRWHWVRTHLLEVAIVILTPPFLPASLQSARVLRYVTILAAVTALPGGAASTREPSSVA